MIVIPTKMSPIYSPAFLHITLEESFLLPLLFVKKINLTDVGKSHKRRILLILIYITSPTNTTALSLKAG